MPSAEAEVASVPPRDPRAAMRYALAAVITVGAVLSQYVVPEVIPGARSTYQSFAGGLAIVYGLPILAFGLLVGPDPLRSFGARMGRATWEGLRWYGLLTLLGLLVSFVLVIVYTALDPGALDLLQRPNPVVNEARSNPWFYVGFAFLVGVCEEVIFRGWLFGFWRGRGGTPWWVHAIWTSAVFAGVHVYYAETYGPAAPFFYPTLFLLGFAFAATYQATGGNLLVVILLHGLNDAAGFLSIVSPSGALGLHYGIVLVGALIGLLHYLGAGPSARPRIPLGPASSGWSYPSGSWSGPAAPPSSPTTPPGFVPPPPEPPYHPP